MRSQNGVVIHVRMQRQFVNGGVRNMVNTVQGNAERLAYNYSQRVVGFSQASAPVRTGRLKRSIKRYRLAKYHHEAVVEAYYGVYVNYGTRYMHAQPFWEPAIAQAKRLYDIDKLRIFRSSP